MLELNVEKLENSDFFDRFLGFAERYDEIYKNSLLPTAITWTTKRESYYMIRFFLAPNPFEVFLPFSPHEFMNMCSAEIEYWQERVTETCALLDEKNALYKEYLSFYE